MNITFEWIGQFSKLNNSQIANNKRNQILRLFRPHLILFRPQQPPNGPVDKALKNNNDNTTYCYMILNFWEPGNLVPVNFN